MYTNRFVEVCMGVSFCGQPRLRCAAAVVLSAYCFYEAACNSIYIILSIILRMDSHLVGDPVLDLLQLPFYQAF